MNQTLGAEVEIHAMGIVRSEDGQIVEISGKNDMLSGLQQLGIVKLPRE